MSRKIYFVGLGRTGFLTFTASDGAREARPSELTARALAEALDDLEAERKRRRLPGAYDGLVTLLTRHLNPDVVRAVMLDLVDMGGFDGLRRM